SYYSKISFCYSVLVRFEIAKMLSALNPSHCCKKSICILLTLFITHSIFFFTWLIHLSRGLPRGGFPCILRFNSRCVWILLKSFF
ncbi:hypothetical protein L9F63_017122, partial [Diploptera punctata]